MISFTARCTLVKVGLLLTLGRIIDSVSAATALSLTPSTDWYGDDGLWSAVSIRLGTPQQWVNLLPNTVSAEIWGVGPYGCQDVASECSTSRGSLFNAAQSSTWNPLLTLESSPIWNLGTGDSLYWPPYGDYGLDNLAFGPDGPTIPNATIAMINATSYWVGSFGLGPSVGNYSYITPNSTYAQLESMGEIVGAGYGYTAGAVYQQKGEPMSLTLGGYDENRFIPHNVSFTLTQDPAVPQAFVESIFVSSSNGSNKSIQLASAGDQISALIDSSTPYLWLPEAVCDRFANALGLTYNDSLNLYTFDENPDQHNNLSESTVTTFTFRFKDTYTDIDIVEINLPYAAFDLQLTYPYIPNTEHGTEQTSKFYFPLARSANTSQYTIGRVFLQEAYIITSYETNKFSLHQAVHVSDTLNNKSIVAIPSGGVTTGQGTGTVSFGSKTEEARLSNGKIAGIVLSVAGTLAIILATFYFSCLKKSKPERFSLNSKNSTSESEASVDFQQPHDLPSLTANGSETHNNNNTPVEINSDAVPPTAINFEIPCQYLQLATAIPEMPLTGGPVELPAVIPADRLYKAFTLDTFPTASSTSSPLSVSKSASLSSNTTLTANYAGPSPERGSISETLPRPATTSRHVSPMSSERLSRPDGLLPIGDTPYRLNPPPIYDLTQSYNYAYTGEIPSSNQLSNRFYPSTGNRTPRPSSYGFAEEMRSGIQPLDLFDPTTGNQDKQVDEWRQRHGESPEDGTELYPPSLVHDESVSETQFQARRHTHRQQLERMEHQGIDPLKYLNGDVGDIQNPFRALDQTHVAHGSYDLFSEHKGRRIWFVNQLEE